MRLHRDDKAGAARARWMAELAAAIDDAQRVAWELGTTGNSKAAQDLYRQLEVARLELESLRGVTRRIREELESWMVKQGGADDGEAR